MDTKWYECFVVHRRPYRETSYLVDLFCQELGSIRIIAKGARGKKSDRRSLLQPLQKMRVQLFGKGELKNLRHIEASENAYQLTGQNLFCAMYVNELLTRVLPQHIPAEGLYDVYVSTLMALQNEVNIELALRRFEFSLLEELGVMPDLTSDSHTGDIVDPDLWYQLAGDSGLIPVARATTGAILGQHLLQLVNDQWNDDVTRLAKRLCRQLLAPLLGDKPLKSRELFLASRP